MKQFLAAVLVAVLVIPSPVFAHGGRTDASGGHTDRSTGEYHYHHGYSAHQHPNGLCPYNFDDQTDHSTGTSSGNSSPETDTPPTNSEPPAPKEPTWVLVEKGFGVDHFYCEETDQWRALGGRIYNSTSDFYQSFGFEYIESEEVWRGVYGYIEPDGTYVLYEDSGLYICPDCQHVIDPNKENNHAPQCQYEPPEDPEDNKPTKVYELQPVSKAEPEDEPLTLEDVLIRAFFSVLALGYFIYLMYRLYRKLMDFNPKW